MTTPILSIIVSFVLFVASMCPLADSKMFPSAQLLVNENEGFLSFIISPIGFKTLHKCEVTLPDGSKMDLDPAPDEPSVYRTVDDVEIQRFSKNTCGVRVKNIKKKLGGKWTLDAMDTDRNNVKEMLMLDVRIESPEPSHKNITVSDGQSNIYLECGDETLSKYSRVFDEKGKEYPGTYVKQVEVYEKPSTWKCLFMKWGQMWEEQTEYTVFKEEKEEVETSSIFETDTHIVLTCRNIGSDSCRAELPQKKKQLLLSGGLLMDHYSSYDTDPTTKKCSVEIEKPLRDEDKGTWRIYSHDKNEIGCVFSLNGDRPKSNENNPILIEVWTKAQNSVVITCEAPYEIDYCYLNSPIKTETEIKPDNFFNTKHLGICKFTVQPISGIYSCGVNDRNGGEDIQTYYKIEAYDTPAKVVSTQIEAKSGKPLQLLVKSIFDHPISYCRFTNPNNNVHGVSEKFKMEGNYRYYGAGLSNGECGLQIKKVSDSEIGMWTCTFSVEGKEYSLQMVVTQSSLLAAAAFIAIPIVVLTSIIGVFIGFIAYRRQKERQATYTEAMRTMRDLDTVSQSSHES